MKLYNKKLFLKIFVTVGLIAILLPKIEWDEAYKLMISINTPIFALLIMAGVFDRLLMSYKWNILLKIKKINLSQLSCLRIYLIGGFFSEFLPTGLGMELYKIQSLKQKGNSLKDVASSIVIERMLGLLATASFAFFSMAAIAAFYDSSLKLYVFPLFLIFLVSFASCMILISSSIWDYVYKLFSKFHDNLIFKKFQSFYDAILDFKNYFSKLWYSLLLSIVEQAYGTILVYIGSLVLGLQLEFIYFFALVPAIFILVRLPISIQGLGLQEGLFVFFFSLAGMQPTEAFSLALVMRFAGWIISLSGGVLYLADYKPLPNVKTKTRVV